MKKFLLAIGASALFLASCGSQKTANQTSQPQQRQQKITTYDLKGEWQIVSVDYDKQFRVKPFDEGADAQCFVGSVWKLIPNNYSGSYSLNGGGNCPAVTQQIKFEVTKSNEFKFKKLQDNVKAKKITEGYVLRLENQQKDSFTLVQENSVGGSIMTVNYQFQRINKK